MFVTDFFWRIFICSEKTVLEILPWCLLPQYWDQYFWGFKDRKCVLLQTLHFSWLWQIVIERKWLVLRYVSIVFITYPLLPIRHSIWVNLCFTIIVVFIIINFFIAKFSCLGFRVQFCITWWLFPVTKVSKKSLYSIFFLLFHWQSLWYCP